MTQKQMKKSAPILDADEFQKAVEEFFWNGDGQPKTPIIVAREVGDEEGKTPTSVSPAAVYFDSMGDKLCHAGEVF